MSSLEFVTYVAVPSRCRKKRVLSLLTHRIVYKSIGGARSRQFLGIVHEPFFKLCRFFTVSGGWPLILKGITISFYLTPRGGSSRWKGGGPNCWPMTGVPGGWPPDGGPGGRAPWRGLQGGRAPLRREILNFWTQFARFGAYFLPTSYWKSLDLFPIKVVFFFFKLWNRPI